MLPEGQGRACCAACGQYFDVNKMDIVTYGTGYRCGRCSEVVAAMEQNVEAIDDARAQIVRRRWFGFLFDLFR